MQSLTTTKSGVLSLCVYEKLFQLPPISDLTTPLTNISEIVSSVYNALSSLDTTKVSGRDGIITCSAKLLKHCTIALYQALHHLYFLSLSQHYIPLEWRTHASNKTNI